MAVVNDLLVKGNTRLVGDSYLGYIKSGIWNGTALTSTYLPSNTIYSTSFVYDATNKTLTINA